MSGNPTRRWLQSRMSEAPPELAADILRLIEDSPGLDLSDPPTALAGAALAGLEQVAAGTGDRGEALRLLAADAALTYAFEAAAESGRAAELAAWVGVDGLLGSRLVREAQARERVRSAEGP